MIFADTIILSDLHLGSEVSRAPAALKMLKSASFNRLILLGDIFSDLNFRRLKKEHWQFLGYIRKLSNPKREIEVVWVEGNHDYGLTQVMSHLVGVRVYREYAWEFAGLRHLAMHGHQFDRFVSTNRLLSTFLSAFHLGIQKISFDDPKGVELGLQYCKLAAQEMPITPIMAYNVFTTMDTTYFTGYPSVDDPYTDPVPNWGNTKYMFVKIKPKNA